MKRILLLCLLCIFSIITSTAQKIELRANVYSGLFSFTGNSATKNSPMVFNPYIAQKIYTRRPYGKTPGASIGASLQFSFLTKAKVLLGLSAGYESLGTTTTIDSLYENGIIYSVHTATGKTKHRGNYLTLTPSIGYRINTPVLKFDLFAGFTVARCLKTTETGDASASTGINYHSSLETTHPWVDTRPGVGVTVHYKRTGLTIGYQWGTKNYYTIASGAAVQPEARSTFLQLGLCYRIW